MEKKGLPQEGLKIIACIMMLMDHIGASLVYEMYLTQHTPALYNLYWLLRTVGRIAFPIYCFLLAEGVHYTKNPKKYTLRLAVGAVLSEIPFDMLFFGEVTVAHSSVMVTLLLGFLYARLSMRTGKAWLKILTAVPFMLAADLLGTDYGGMGVAMIALFVYTRDIPHRKLIQMIGLAVVCWLIGGATVPIGGVRVPLELFGLLALIPIFCYSGRKSTGNPWVQWGFYLFYPVHLTTLLVIMAVK